MHNTVDTFFPEYFSDVYQIGIGRCLQWNIVMNNDIGGGVRDVPEGSIHMQKSMENN